MIVRPIDTVWVIKHLKTGKYLPNVSNNHLFDLRQKEDKHYEFFVHEELLVNLKKAKYWTKRTGLNTDDIERSLQLQLERTMPSYIDFNVYPYGTSRPKGSITIWQYKDSVCDTFEKEFSIEEVLGSDITIKPQHQIGKASVLKFRKVYQADQFRIITDDASHNACTHCGMTLGRIPRMTSSWKGVNLCVFCIRKLATELDTHYNSLDPEWIKLVEQERFLQKL